MDFKLPWIRYFDNFGHPVAVWTILGALLAGDDGNIFVAYANGKAYAIEVSIKPEHLEDVKSRNKELLIPGPTGVGYGRVPGNSHWDSVPDVLNKTIASAKKAPRHQAYLKTNVGLEDFDLLLFHLNQTVWNATSVQLESAKEVSLLRDSRWAVDETPLKYEAREIMLAY